MELVQNVILTINNLSFYNITDIDYCMLQSQIYRSVTVSDRVVCVHVDECQCVYCVCTYVPYLSE